MVSIIRAGYKSTDKGIKNFVTEWKSDNAGYTIIMDLKGNLCSNIIVDDTVDIGLITKLLRMDKFDKRASAIFAEGFGKG